MDYEEMSDRQIDRAIVDLKFGEHDKDINRMFNMGKLNYCNNPSDAWPIIVESKISINHDIARYSADSLVYDKKFNNGFKIFRHVGDMGDTSSRAALRAAMICFLKMKEF